MKAKSGRVAAAIDIGSSAVRMRVAQWNRGTVEILDKLEKTVHIGQEVFSTGRIQFETLRELSAILEGFSEIARGYGVEKPRVVGTTAIREASNRAYVLDHLRIHNRLDVEVLEESESGAIIFSQMLRFFKEPPPKLMMVYSGTGSIGLAAYEEGNVTFSQSLRTGSLRISDVLELSAASTRGIGRVAEEYMAVFLDYVERLHDFGGTRSVAISGYEIDPLPEICGAVEEDGVQVIETMRLLTVWEQIKGITPHQLAARYDISPERGERLYATLTIYAGLVKLTQASRIHCPRIEMLEALLWLQLRPGAKRAFDDGLRAGALASALNIARRYRCNIAHAEHTARTASILFENLRKIHGLSRSQSVLLESACLMHEIGYYVNGRNAAAASGALVRDAYIYGLRGYDAALVASIIDMQDAACVPAQEAVELRESDFLFAAKMHALLSLTSALDHSRLQKCRVTAVEVLKNRLIIHLTASADTALEELEFANASPLFEDVFGLAPKLSITRKSL